MKNNSEKFKILKKYSAKNRISAMSKVYKEVKEWQLFARKIQKNIYFKETKLKQQNYICPICDEHYWNVKPYII